MAKKAVILLSGGMDSALCTGIAKEMGYEIAALHTNYGQRTENKELDSFNKIADHYKAVDRLIVNIGHLKAIGASSLTDDNIAVSNAHLDTKEIPTSYVPFRNSNLLAIAVSWAEVIGANAIFIGAIEEDSSGYPDTRKIFIDAFQKVIDTGTKDDTNIELIAPIIDLNKSEIVRKGTELKVPFEYTWSCYKNSVKACGVCDSCTLRIRGFAKAGIEDPIEYEQY